MEAFTLRRCGRPRVIEANATLTDRYQTTVPKAVRQALGLGKRDQIRFVVRSDRSVILDRAEPDLNDPALGPFLELLATDLLAHPERLRRHAGDVLERAREFVVGVAVEADVEADPDTPLDTEPA